MLGCLSRMSVENAWAGEALYRLAHYTNCTGEAYFRGLVCGLADVLSVRYALVAEICPGAAHRARTVAVWADGRIAANFEYDLANTPCAQVLTAKTCFYPSGVVGLFPEDLLLAEMGAVSYVGTPLRGLDGRTFGLLVAMHDQPIDPSRHPQALLELVAGRAAAELERSRVDSQLRQSEQRIRFLSE